MPPLPSDAKPRAPGDYAPVLATKEPILLVGGQAVNLWALYYKDRTGDLAPFVSRDADVLGDHGTLIELGKLAGSKPQFFPLRPPSNELGVVIAKDVNGQPLLIEVLRYVEGATNEELREPVYTMALGEQQVRVQVPGPIALFKAKIANVAALKQEGRQDARHIRILACLLPAYLNDLGRAVVDRRLEERKFLGFLQRLLAVVTPTTARKTLAAVGIDSRALFSEINPDGLPKISTFLSERLRRALRMS